jgi:hypothetical protein
MFAAGGNLVATDLERRHRSMTVHALDFVVVRLGDASATA